MKNLIKIPRNSPLLQKSPFNPNSEYIMFCANEGFFHESYCAICPAHLGDSSFGNLPRERRNSGTCRINAIDVGKIDVKREVMSFDDQADFSQKLAQWTYINADYHGLKVPVDASAIKHANQPDIKVYDHLKCNRHHCERCGESKSGMRQFACLGTFNGEVGCGTRQLCENCIQDVKRWKEDENQFISFRCPQCNQLTELGVGKDESNITIYDAFDRPNYIDNNVTSENEWGDVTPNPFVEVDYNNFADAIQSSQRSDERIRLREEVSNLENFLKNENISKVEFMTKPPSMSDPKVGFISEGLMRGAYYYSVDDEKAYVYHKHDQKRSLKPLPQVERNHAGLNDFVISYAKEDIELARKFAQALSVSKFFSSNKVYLLDIEENEGDTLWSIRYREELFFTTYFLPLISPHYLKRSGSALELYDAIRISREHTPTDMSCLNSILPILMGVNVSDFSKGFSRWSRENRWMKVQEKLGERVHAFDQDTFSASHIPFYLNMANERYIPSICDFMDHLNAMSRHKSYGFIEDNGLSFLQLLKNKLVGIITSGHEGRPVLVLKSIWDWKKAHLVQLSLDNFVFKTVGMCWLSEVKPDPVIWSNLNIRDLI